MPFQYAKTKRTFLIIISSFLITGLCHQLGREYVALEYISSLLNPFYYLFMEMVWIHSIQRRIVQPVMYRLLTGIGYSGLFWFVIRQLRYTYLKEYPLACHYIWYLYYFPAIFILGLSFMTVFYIGTDQGQKQRKMRWSFWFFSALLVLFVLTNDLHQQVFQFPWEERWNAANDHTYSWGFYLVILWIASTVIAMIFFLIRQARVQKIKKYFYIPLVIFATGGILILLKEQGIQDWYNFPEILSFTYLAILESCIQIGYIPSNINYDIFFFNAKIPVWIKDEKGNIEYISREGERIGRLQETSHFVFREQMLQSGTVCWMEDNTNIDFLNEELADIQEQLQEESMLLREENKLRERRAKIEEKSRIYDELSVFMNPYLFKMEHDMAQGVFEERLPAVCIEAAYIKRRCNLMLLGREQNEIKSGEFLNCLRESADYLELYGVAVTLSGEADKRIQAADAIALYDLFEKLIEQIIETLKQMVLYLGVQEGRPLLRVMSGGEISNLCQGVDSVPGTVCEVSREEDTCFITLRMREGGEPS